MFDSECKVRFTRHLSTIAVWAVLVCLLGGCSKFTLSQTDSQPVVISLDGSWKFQFDPDEKGIEAGWQSQEFDDSAWNTMEVPGDWGDVDGIGWYRKRIDLPTEFLNDDRYQLMFRQVDDAAQVYLNGQLAIENDSWNTPFNVAIKDYIDPNGDLQIAVRVDDHGGNGGILRKVEIRRIDSLLDLYLSDEYELTPHSTLEENGSTVMYSVFVRNFSEEGTLDALTARLPELKNLGVNMLWLLPIQELGIEKRKGPDGSPYALKDYYKIEPSIGTDEDFHELVEAAHRQDMRVIIDLVVNHTSPDATWTKEHVDWYELDENGKPKPENPWWEDVVDLDWENAEVQEAVTEMMEYWVREFDIDGFRCDHPQGMPMEWWKSSIDRLEAIKPVFMLAESSDLEYHLNGFDLTYCEDVRNGLHDILCDETPVSAMGETVIRYIYSNPKGATQMIFLENHDKPRAINYYETPEKTKVAGVLIATLPGVPLLYTGTEVGANYDRNETFFTRVPVDFSTDPHDMREFWTSLFTIRAAHPALQTGDFILVDVEPADKVFAFERAKGRDRVLVIVNLSGDSVNVKLDHPLKPKSGIVLPAYGWEILTSK